MTSTSNLLVKHHVPSGSPAEGFDGYVHASAQVVGEFDIGELAITYCWAEEVGGRYEQVETVVSTVEWEMWNVSSCCHV